MTAESSGLALHLKRVLHAPRSRVFRALTEPNELAKWWGPHGFTSPSIEFDLRVGGSYRIAMQPPEGDLFYLQGEFREVDPPSRLAYTFRWEDPTPDDQETVVTLSLRDLVIRRSWSYLKPRSPQSDAVRFTKKVGRTASSGYRPRFLDPIRRARKNRQSACASVARPRRSTHLTPPRSTMTTTTSPQLRQRATVPGAWR
jgi:uncharacterized protein YndB with AHSA1/START domain